MGSKLTLNDELMFPSEYVSALEFKGKDVRLTITAVARTELTLRGGGKKIRPVLTFQETPKKLVLNPTNAESIAEMYGTKAESWIGKQITLYPTTTKFGREMVDCIRVREIKGS
jgi:hypothetical protein